MKHKLGTSLGLIAVGAVLAGTGTAAAATGGTFLLGKDNTATVSTVLRNSGTTPNLTLPAARAGQAPLAVSPSSGKVLNFNADKLDGVDSTAFSLAAGKVGSVEAMGAPLDWDGDGVPEDFDGDGVPDMYAAYAECPKGSKLTGGGHWTLVGAPVSAPDLNGWLVIDFADATTVPEDVYAVAQCYNPRGAIPGAVPSSTFDTTTVDLDEAQKARLLKLAAKR